MAIKLILTDIDGTVLPQGQKVVSRRTIAAIHAALDAGLVVGPASGRGFAWIPAFFGGDDACCATALATNGMQIYVSGEKVMEQTLPAAALERVRAITAETPGAGLVCFDDMVPLVASGTRGDLTRAFPAYGEKCVELGRLPEFAVVKANVFFGGDEAGMVELVARLNAEVDGLDFDVPQAGFSNVMPAGWNKGAALAWLQDHLGVTREETVVFGDAGNDLALFAQAGHPVAVAGALPEAAAAARWHIGACEDDAVAAAIEVLAVGDWPFER